MLALAPALLDQVLPLGRYAMAVNYGLDRVRLPTPLPVGERVRMRVTRDAAEPIPGGVALSLSLAFERAGGGKPACVAGALLRGLRIGTLAVPRPTTRSTQPRPTPASAQGRGQARRQDSMSSSSTPPPGAAGAGSSSRAPWLPSARQSLVTRAASCAARRRWAPRTPTPARCSRCGRPSPTSHGSPRCTSARRPQGASSPPECSVTSPRERSGRLPGSPLFVCALDSEHRALGKAPGTYVPRELT